MEAAYYRVSTNKQGKAGLGLDARRKAVLDYLDGGEWECSGEFTEIESGKHSDRPELEGRICSLDGPPSGLLVGVDWKREVA